MRFKKDGAGLESALDIISNAVDYHEQRVVLGVCAVLFGTRVVASGCGALVFRLVP